MSIEIIGVGLLFMLLAFVSGFIVGTMLQAGNVKGLRGHINVLQDANDSLTGTIASLRDRLSRSGLTDDEFDKLFPHADPDGRGGMHGSVPERGGAAGDGLAGAGEPDQGVDQDGVADPLP